MPTNTTPPKVFISHATEDKDRFVTKFAARLRENGIDAWLDQWEMLPGDSLVTKIFEQGIGNASAFLVVLSSISVIKPWVVEELNAAFVKRISGLCRIIPVILEDCEVPVCLHSTLWQRIDNLDDYQDALQRIVNAIHGVTVKPPIGPAPAHTQVQPLFNAPSLDKIDAIIFEALCEEGIRANETQVIDPTCLDKVSGITDEELGDSLKILNDENYIEPSYVLGSAYRGTGISHIRISPHAFDKFAKLKWPEYDAILEMLISGLVNESWRRSTDVEKLAAPPRLREHLIEILEQSGHIRVSRYFGGYFISDVSPKLKRVLREN